MRNKLSTRVLKKLTPRFVRTFLLDLIGVTELREKVNQLEKNMVDIRKQIVNDTGLPANLRDRSQYRWVNAAPDKGLTWGVHITGDAFIEKVNNYHKISPDDSILEIGPGYGRLLNSLLQSGAQFKKYVGVDISEKNVAWLVKNFKDDPRISFTLGDVELLSLNQMFTVAISSLTFKHLYPSFEKVILNVSRHLDEGGYVFFDLMEGKMPASGFDWATFVRIYSNQEINEILSRTSLKLVAFDQVVHDAEHTRPLVIARK